MNESADGDRQRLLWAHGVFDVDSYGWRNDEFDDEFLGYAMWWTSPPHDYGFPGEASPRLPTDRAQALMELGADYFGLMKTARYFIGGVLSLRQEVEPLRVDVCDFDFHEFAAVMSLSAAGDRLRDFFITAALGRKTDEKGERDRAYEAVTALGLGAQATSLRELGRTTAGLRGTRNVLAHGRATRPANLQRELRELDRALVERASTAEAAAGHARLEAMWESAAPDEAASIAETQARVERLAAWYQAVVKLGNATFELENRLRSRLLKGDV